MRKEDVRKLYDTFRHDDTAGREYKIRQLAEDVVNRRWETYSDRVMIPWQSARASAYMFKSPDTLPPAGSSSSYSALELIVPPVADERTARLVVEAQIREQLWEKIR